MEGTRVSAPIAWAGRASVGVLKMAFVAFLAYVTFVTFNTFIAFITSMTGAQTSRSTSNGRWFNAARAPALAFQATQAKPAKGPASQTQAFI